MDRVTGLLSMWKSAHNSKPGKDLRLTGFWGGGRKAPSQSGPVRSGRATSRCYFTTKGELGMHTSRYGIALAGLLAMAGVSVAAEAPSWATDYRAALSQVAKDQKPLAVIVA